MDPHFQVTFDAHDPEALARFWAMVLGYQVRTRTQEHTAVIVDPAGVRPALWFRWVPETKIAKNRVHLDVEVETEDRRKGLAMEADRLESLGAERVRSAGEGGEHWIVMTDPEGNEFCLWPSNSSSR